MRLSQSYRTHQGLKGILLSLTLWVGSEAAITCEDARLKCAYREGCGKALQNFIISCSSLHQLTRNCPEECQNALIALTSTDEGQQFMSCDCDDQYCKETKERVEVCRPQVLRATMNETIVSCTVAQWICGADTLCSTALNFYHIYCRSMFLGKRCSLRCENSINILRRQEKAAKLNTCFCNGREDYDCDAIRRNMETMCFVKKLPHGVKPPPPAAPDVITNEVIPRHHSSAISTSPALLTLLCLLYIHWRL
ncbi:hypothetical protein GE061_000803 [Apolygus lucorum]|uniref:GDNF/GAS1 domain-containing protein n=1 Tax=Apolygus lucorum TaxID=248454 RepID=A0A6A4KLT2_APOLU|nr:hypothetical protein GE061_000803 [Apolygus lucorum]